jgi:hypothetical protein
MARTRVPGTLRRVNSRGPRHALGPGVAGFFAAALMALVVLALAAPERHAAPRGGEFAAAGRQSSPSGAAEAGHGAFDVRAGGVRVHGFFISPDRATGTLTRSVGRCAIASAQWTARRTTSG